MSSIRLSIGKAYSLTNRVLVLSICSALIGLIIYTVLGSLLTIIPRWIFTVAITVLFSAVLAHFITSKERNSLERLEYAIKNALNGDYGTRVEYGNDDPHRELFEQINEFLEQTEQKLSYLQVLGEARVLQESASIESAVLEERKRLARDLHDSVSQQLFAIHMCASSISKLREVNPKQADQVLLQLVTMSSTAQQQMRKFIAHLRPMELENRSLLEALSHWYPDYCRQNNIQGKLDYRIEAPLSEAKEHQLFLIIQEGMANIVKHAQCESCQLTLYETESQVIMTLQDDGIGFKPKALSRKSYGLSTMQERAQKLSGLTEIISKEGGGTIVKVTIPKLKEKELQS